MGLRGCYTEKERQQIINGARAYDELVRKQLEAEKPVERNPHQWVIDLYNEFIARNYEEIQDIAKFIGLLGKIKITFAESINIQHLVRHFTNMAIYDIEGLNGEIEAYISFKQRFEELSG